MADTDRELLEWAAKSAGYTGGVEFRGLTDECFFVFDANTARRTWQATWDPLYNDGDSRRLEVMLNMTVYVMMTFTEIRKVSLDGSIQRAIAQHDGNPFAATRRAVLRVAAEIGKAMP